MFFFSSLLARIYFWLQQILGKFVSNTHIFFLLFAGGRSGVGRSPNVEIFLKLFNSHTRITLHSKDKKNCSRTKKINNLANKKLSAES
jgi:hypothetical protein